MRWMRFALVALFVGSLGILAHASARAEDQPKPAATSAPAKTPEDMAKEALAKWKTTLKITDEQAPQFESVMTDSYQKMMDARTAAAGDKSKMKASMQTIMKDRQEALAKVLTPEQMKTYNEKVKGMAKHGKKKMEKMEKEKKEAESSGK